MLGIYIYLAVSILIGALACFWGKKLFFQVFSAIVFLVVYDLAMSFGDASTLAILIAILLGIGAAFLSKYLYKVSVFLLGAVVGAALGELAVAIFPAELGPYHWPVVIVLGVILGLCAIRWSKLFIILSTAYTGASILSAPATFLALNYASLRGYAAQESIMATAGRMSAYLSGSFADAHSQTLLTVTILLTLAGFLVQRFTAWRD